MATVRRRLGAGVAEAHQREPRERRRRRPRDRPQLRSHRDGVGDQSQRGRAEQYRAVLGGPAAGVPHEEPANDRPQHGLHACPRREVAGGAGRRQGDPDADAQCEGRVAEHDDDGAQQPGPRGGAGLLGGGEARARAHERVAQPREEAPPPLEELLREPFGGAAGGLGIKPACYHVRAAFRA